MLLFSLQPLQVFILNSIASKFLDKTRNLVKSKDPKPVRNLIRGLLYINHEGNIISSYIVYGRYRMQIYGIIAHSQILVEYEDAKGNGSPQNWGDVLIRKIYGIKKRRAPIYIKINRAPKLLLFVDERV